jgi:3-phenylpropionate/cinnamic acid dioxygenase small subunit
MAAVIEAADLKAKVDDLYAAYVQTLCDGDLEKWPDFFVEDCVYKLISRVNYERNLPISPIFSENRGALIDRVRALKSALVYAPRAVCYVVGSVRIVGRAGGGWDTRSMFSAYQTFVEGESNLMMCGRTFDRVVLDGDTAKFSRRVVVYDNERVPSAVVYPL